MNNVRIERCVGGWRVCSRTDTNINSEFTSSNMMLLAGFVMGKLEELE